MGSYIAGVLAGKKKTLILIGFIVAKFLLQYFLVNPEYELHRDEFLHLDQAHHLAWGYLSVPPVTSWISLIISFLGNSVFWIRFFPSLFGALTIVVVWKTIEELKGNLFALILGSTGILFSVLLRLNILYQPNSLDVLCWTAFYFFLIRYLNSQKTKWLFLCAVAFAVGFLNKYNILFALIGFLPALLLTRQRTVLVKREVGIAALLALALISPNLLWQYQNHFPVFHHLKELSDTQLVNVNRWDFVREQVLYFIGALFMIVAAFFGLLFYPPFKKYQAFFWSFFFTLSVFIYLRAKSYYAIGLYPIYVGFGAAYLGELFKVGWKKYLRPVALILPVIAFIPIYNVGFPNKSPQYIVDHQDRYRDLGLLRWEDGKDHRLPQDFADMLGWKELAAKTESAYSKLPGRTLILCDNYGQAGAINYYSKNEKIAAVSFNADYINWFDLSKRYDNLIRVKSDPPGNELEKTGPFFEISFDSGSITTPLSREHGTTIFIFQKAKIDIRERISDEIRENKNQAQ